MVKPHLLGAYKVKHSLGLAFLLHGLCAVSDIRRVCRLGSVYTTRPNPQFSVVTSFK